VVGLRLYRAMAAIETGAAVPAPHKSPSPLRPSPLAGEVARQGRRGG
jgi:hypothetical protein